MMDHGSFPHGTRQRQGRTSWHLSGAACAGLVLAFGLLLGVAQAAEPGFEIVSPADGSTVTSPVTLRVEVTGVKIGQPSTGGYHLHISVDGGPEQALYENAPQTYALAPGEHTIGVDLAYPTHQTAVPEKTVTFTVK